MNIIRRNPNHYDVWTSDGRMAIRGGLNNTFIRDERKAPVSYFKEKLYGSAGHAMKDIIDIIIVIEEENK